MQDNGTQRREIGARIKRCRIAAGLTQDKLSEKIGIEVRSYANIESGNRLFSVEVLMKLSAVLGISTDYILTGAITDSSPVNVMLKALSPENLARVQTILKAFCEAAGESGCE